MAVQTVAGRALIFDMDGVLIDSEPLHLIAYQDVLGPFGVSYTEEHNSQYLGKKDREIAPLIISHFGIDADPHELVKEKDARLQQLLREHPYPRAGVVEVLEEARRLSIRTAVASSSSLSTIRLIVNTLGISDFFDCFASGEEVARGKPEPDVFLLAAERLGVEPAQCLVIEDTETGVAAAIRAGMRCVAIPCDATRHQRHEQAHERLESLEELDLGSWLSEETSPNGG